MPGLGESCGAVIPGADAFVGDPSAALAAQPFDLAGRWQAAECPCPLERGRVQAWAIILLALSALDFLMTARLLKTSPLFYEANPVAQWFFARWDLAGLMGFKFVIILGVIALGEFIERRRTGWGRLVLGFGSIAATYAIIQGAALLDHPAATGEADDDEIRIEAFRPSFAPVGPQPCFEPPGPMPPFQPGSLMPSPST